MEFFNDAGEDPLKPTLFELVAQEQLRDLLQPALKYVLSVRDVASSRTEYATQRVSGVCAIIPTIPPAHSE